MGLRGEAVVITAAVLAADGELSVVLVGAAALVGGFTGDNAGYGAGAGVGERAARRLLRGDRGRRMLGCGGELTRRVRCA